MKSGLLLVDKEQGLTSAAVVARLKKNFSFRKVGHAGTLDPMATGLLVCLTEKATRFASFAGGGDKIYSGSIRFGTVTDSDDITGQVLKTSTVRPSLTEIQSQLPLFTGVIQQIPPQVSAVKVEGRRAYAMARSGEQVELESREVTIAGFEVSQLDEDTLSFRIKCSGGTYIRSIARDLGEALGCGACLASLRREASAPFMISQARKLADLQISDIIGLETLFPDAIRFTPGEALLRRLRSGDERALRDVDKGFDSAQNFALYFSNSGELCGLLKRGTHGWEYSVNLQE